MTTTLVKAKWAAILSLVAAIGAFQLWLPAVQEWLAPHESAAGHREDHDDTANHDSHAGHAETSSLKLSVLARKNIGLRTGVVAPANYTKSVAVPAMVVERPGRSQVEITAPMTGIVTRVYPIEGEALEPGQPLFELRLTHEDLVVAQRDFLRSAQELDLVKREIQRLEAIGEGVIAGRRVVEQKYGQEKVEAALHAQRQGLLLHGLTDGQIDDIQSSRRLLSTLTVAAPDFEESSDHHDVEHMFHVQAILINRGQSVSAGQSLAMLADHCLLYVEGQAFEEDAERLVQAAREGWLIDVGAGRGKSADTMQLEVFYVADQIDRESRALRFYLLLPNATLRDQRTDGHRFVAWKHRPGQRVEARIPLGQPWSNQIVVPPAAVVDEGAEAYVFEQNGDHFDRVPVHVVYRDQDAIVLENDGSLIGSTIAMNGAYQMHLAIKNQAGGGVDPHAGHNH